MITCIDLLPQNNDALVRNNAMKHSVVNLLALITKNLIASIDFFYRNKNVSCFDPHVGETSCQIRGYITLLLAEQIKGSRVEQLCLRKKELSEVHSKLTSVKFDVIDGNNKLTMFEFIKSIDCLYELTSEENYLVNAYVLTVYKRELLTGDTCIDFDLLAQHAGISRKLSKKFVRCAQILLARYSCDYVYRWAKEINFPCDQYKVLTQLKYLDDDSREVLPCYFYSKVLFDHLIDSGLPILFNIERPGGSSLFFYSSLDKKLVKKLPEENTFLSAFFFVIEGVSDYADESLLLACMNKKGVRAVFLANMASHPQYSGRTLSVYAKKPFLTLNQDDLTPRRMDAELMAMRKLSYEIGCSRENPALFLTRHIYCDALKNQYVYLQRAVKTSRVNKIEAAI